MDTDANTFAYRLRYTALGSPEIAAHIHGPAARGEVSLQPLTFLPLGTPRIGVWNYPENLEADVLGGRTYFNVHSEVWPNGEIRGQIEPAAPGGDRIGWMALGAALLAAGTVVRRRAHRATPTPVR